MPRINSIQLHLATGRSSGAGTDGDIYLGVCGREFSVDSAGDHDDFEAGSNRSYVFGDGANVNNSEVNDPRLQNLFTENVSLYPAYIRFQPRGRGDNWQLVRADVRFNDTVAIWYDTHPTIDFLKDGSIWLGVRSGLVVHLVNHVAHDRSPMILGSIAFVPAHPAG